MKQEADMDSTKKLPDHAVMTFEDGYFVVRTAIGRRGFRIESHALEFCKYADLKVVRRIG